MLVAGVELGGTKCVCTLGSGPGEVADRRVVRTTSPEETLGTIEHILGDWWETERFAALDRRDFSEEELAEIDRHAEEGGIDIWKGSSALKPSGGA